MPIRPVAVLALAVVALVAAPAHADVPTTLFDYKTFASPDPLLAPLGGAEIRPPALRLVERTDSGVAGGVWYKRRIDVSTGWQTRFVWQLSRAVGDAPEGLAFVIQDQSVTARGDAGSGRGYGGIAGSLAIAIHPTPNTAAGEPDLPYISIQTRGTAANTANFVDARAFARDRRLADGRPHVLTVRYDPQIPLSDGVVHVYLDDSNDPLLAVPQIELNSLLGLDHGRAWIGFTAANGAAPNLETADITAWSFKRLVAPTRLAITSAPVKTTAGTPAPVVVQLQGPDGKPVIAPSDLDVTLRSTSGGFSVEERPSSARSIVLTIPADESSATAYYSDTAAGRPTISANVGGLPEVTQEATIAPGAAAHLQIGSAGAAIDAGMPQAYTVNAVDQYGNDRGPDPAVKLTIVPDGTCSLTTCSATVAGPHFVFFSDGPLRETAELTVRPGPAASIRLSPASATITAGEEQAYAAEIVDVWGNRRPQDAAVLTIAPDGTCTANSCTAGAPGEHTVTAAAGAWKEKATLTVKPPAADPPATPVAPEPVADPTPASAAVTPPAGAGPTRATTSPATMPARYRFAGLRAPLRNGKLNRVGAGRTVALKWRLTDAAGAAVTTLRTARLSVMPCRGKGITTRTYRVQHLGGGNYRLKWKSGAKDAGTCKRLRLDVGDGVPHAVDLKITRRR